MLTINVLFYWNTLSFTLNCFRKHLYSYPPSLTTLEILLLVHTFLWRFGKNFGKISNDTYKDGMGMVIFHFSFHLTQYIRGRKLMIFQFLPFYIVLIITLTKLQFDWLIHEVMRCECLLQYATGSLMLCVVCWISLFRTSIFTQITAKEPSLESMCNINLFVTLWGLKHFVRNKKWNFAIRKMKNWLCEVL